MMYEIIVEHAYLGSRQAICHCDTRETAESIAKELRDERFKDDAGEMRRSYVYVAVQEVEMPKCQTANSS